MNLEQFDWSAEEHKGLFEKVVPTHLLQNPLMQKDVWLTIDDLNLKVNAHRKILTLNLEALKPDWFKLLVKLYIFVKAKPNTCASTAQAYITYFNKFSRFLVEKNIAQPKQINNQIFEEYEYYLVTIKLKDQGKYLNRLGSFFDVCRREGWLDINTYWFKGKCNRVRPNNDKIEYIPEEVWHQLEDNLHYLPEQFQRMILLIKTTGLRVGELLNLPLDCLRKRGNQWRLRLTTEKYDVEDEISIAVPELVTVLKEQQKYIKDLFGEEFKNLFCSNQGGRSKKNEEFAFYPVPRIMYSCSFNNWLNRLANKANIRTKDGKLWHFTSHQFRRTVATVMSNAGIRDFIITKYLRHRTPEMLAHYQCLFIQTLGDEHEQLTKEKKYVDITGKVVERIKPKDIIAEYIRRKMYPLTTQYGECHRPILKSPCLTVNACWRCEHWRVSDDDFKYLQEDLERLEEELQQAKTLGLTKQQQGLEGDRDNLVTIIEGLRGN